MAKLKWPLASNSVKSPSWVIMGHGKALHSAKDVHQHMKQRTRFLRVLFLEFRGFFLCLLLVFAVSCCILYFVYPKGELPHQQMTWLQAIYYTWLMIFFQNPLPIVENWLVYTLFFGLPIVGMVTIAEGVVHLGNLLFQRKRHSREWQKLMAATYENHIVVCGLGNVGVRVVQHLVALGENVVAIEAVAHARFIQEAERLNVPVLVGDARDTATLENASTKKAKAIVAVTDNDLTNLETALTAREMHPQIKVIIRMFDQKLAKQVEKSLGLDGAYSSSARSSRLFAQAAISENILDSFEFGGTTINAYQLIVEANTFLVGATIDQIRHKFEVTVLLQEKSEGELDWNPSPNNVLAVGDRLLIMTDRAGIKRLNDATTRLSLPVNYHD
jgi:Trk K+ transport system NAD-binding subunit